MVRNSIPGMWGTASAAGRWRWNGRSGRTPGNGKSRANGSNMAISYDDLNAAAVFPGQPAWAPLWDVDQDRDSYAAVIDIGSGSARAVVMRVNDGGGIEVIAQQSMNLDLMSHLGSDGMLEQDSVAITLDAIEDFVMVCLGYGVSTINAVGTAALRESGNVAAITDAVARRFGVNLRIISGYEEAVYCFIGAVHGLPVDHGLMADIGGGSMELVQFDERSLSNVYSLPLGSLRVSNMFRLTDQPAPEDLNAAFNYVRNVLADAEVPALRPRGTLVGSGGSIRLLSKLDRRKIPYPILKMHGYHLGAGSLGQLTQELAEADRIERIGMPGMNRERAHSIVGGAVVAQGLMEHAAANGILVSGQGLREGLARHPEILPSDGKFSLPNRSRVRFAGLADLLSRFAPRFSQRGHRRASFARRIAASAWRGRHRRLTGSLQCAALLLDIGNAMDFYNRLNRAAAVVVRSDLPGFTHRESAQIAAVMLVAERGRVPRQFRQSQVLTGGDKRRLGQAAAALLVADELDRRLPPECPEESVSIARHAGQVCITTPAWSKVSEPSLCDRWEREFNEPLQIRRAQS